MEGFSKCIKIANQAAQQGSSGSFTLLPILVPILDVVTRWNSTYYMLERAHRFRTVSKLLPIISQCYPYILLIASTLEAIDVLCCHEYFKKLYEKYMLFDEEWDMVELVTNSLGVWFPCFICRCGVN